MSKIVELASHEAALVAGGEDCIDPDPGHIETVEEMIARMLQGVTAPLN